MGIATILDPRFKIIVLNICFEDLLGTVGKPCEDKVIEVKNLLTDLISEYHVEDVEGSQLTTTLDGNGDDFLSSISARLASVGFRSKLDRYLDEELVNMHTKNFNVLDWWKVAGTRFPTLRRIARDIYAIPVTTVASESAFSTGGRVLCEHRSRLTSKMLEALMCSQDWLRNKYKGIKIPCFFYNIFVQMSIEWLQTGPFHFVVDEKTKEQATFWSCLQDIQEGLQVMFLPFIWPYFFNICSLMCCVCSCRNL